MAEYIDREAVLQHKRKMSGTDWGGEFWDEAVLCEDICKIPAADVAEVRHGKWIEYKIPNIIGCSECDWGTGVDEKSFKYCPNCGAKMDGE